MFPESSSPVSPELLMTLKLTPSLTLLPPLMPASSLALSPLVPVSPSAHPQSAPSGRSDLPRDVKSPALPWCEDALSPPPVSLRVLDSTSVLRPIGSVLVPSSL